MTTAATPMIMPSSVSTERSLCAHMAASASFNVSTNFIGQSITQGPRYWLHTASSAFVAVHKSVCLYKNVTPALLVAQSLYGVEASGLPRGPESEDYADGRGDAYADEYRPEGDEGRERRVLVREKARHLADYQ